MKLMAIFWPQPDECWDSSDEVVGCYCDLIQSKLEKVKKLCHSGPSFREHSGLSPGSTQVSAMGSTQVSAPGSTQVTAPGST